MDKIKLEFKLPRRKTVKYKEVEISLLPFLDMAQQVYLINSYVENYFEITEESVIDNTEYNYIEAEYKLKNMIFQMLTNIDIESITNDIYVEPELWEVISSNIKNFENFRNTLDIVVQDIKEQLVLQNSVGKVLHDLIQKVYEILDKFSDMSPEELEKLQKQGVELIERLEKSSVLGQTTVKE